MAKRITGHLLSGAADTHRDRLLGVQLEGRRRYVQYRFDYPFEWLSSIPLPLKVRYRRAARGIAGRLGAEIPCRLAASSPLTDLLTLMHSWSSLFPAGVLDEAITVSITSYVTLGVALAWDLWLTALHPAVALRIREEAVTALARDEPWNHLPFTAALLADAMRIHPPAWISPRIAAGADRLPSRHPVNPGDKL
jgi:cytochrome P450